eukprot:6637285-Pyramimonas_sp.AAC.2
MSTIPRELPSSYSAPILTNRTDWNHQVYLIMDEFILSGELQETSKKVRAGPKPTCLFPREDEPGACSNGIKNSLGRVDTFIIVVMAVLDSLTFYV